MFEWLKKIFGKQEKPIEQIPHINNTPKEVVEEKPMMREAESEPKTCETAEVLQPKAVDTLELPKSVQAEIEFQQGLITTMKEVLSAKEKTVETKSDNGEYIWLAQRPTEDGNVEVAKVPVGPKKKAPKMDGPKKKSSAPKKVKEQTPSKQPRKKKAK